MLVGGVYRSIVVLVGMCLLGVSIAVSAQESDPVAKRRAQLEAELAKIEQQIQHQQVLLDGKAQERVSLERDVAILDGEIEKALLNIQARELAIRGLSDDIYSKQTVIDELNLKLEREKESLAQLVRKTNELDNSSVVEVILSNKNLSEFFEAFDDLQSLKFALNSSFSIIEETREYVRSEKQVLEGKREEEVDMKILQELQKQEVEEQEAKKQEILDVTKGQEAAYQQMVHASQRTAAEIRAELFQLRGTSAIPLGEALELANFASSKTGVRPAFILGVLKQETRLGELKGDGTWQEDMHPQRDRPVFMAIMQELGLNPSTMPVSAGGATYWGGAMGPSQFIPSTWACYGGFINATTNTCANAGGLSFEGFWAGPWKYNQATDRIRSYTGGSQPSNPYNNRDAFMATALYMKDLGADLQTFEAERRAALRYYAGGNWAAPANAFYGDAVMGHAAYYQEQINILGGL